MSHSGIFHTDFVNEPYWWQHWRPSQASVASELPARVSVAIVGGGYAGLSTALELSRHGIDAVVLEALDPGEGASTRNGGGVSGGVNLGKSLSGRRVDYAPGEREAILQEAAKAYGLVEQLIQQYGIACHWNNAGRFVGAWTPAHFKKQEASIPSLNESAQSGAYMVSQHEQTKEVATDLYFGGLVISRSSTLHPALYYQGLLGACQQAGVRILGRTPVQKLQKQGSDWELHTPKGTVRAEHVVIATNGYTGDLTPQLKRRIIPVASHSIVTEPLPDGLAEQLLPSNKMINDTLRVRSYYRLTPDGKRLLFGGRGRFGAAGVQQHSQALYAFMLERLPQLKGIRITHGWSGNVAFTFDATPNMGCTDRVHYMLGCNGSGVAMMTYMGYRTARKIARVDEPASALDRTLKGNPLYFGNPWFLPVIGNTFRVLDKVDRLMARA